MSFVIIVELSSAFALGLRQKGQRDSSVFYVINAGYFMVAKMPGS
jgi:hypothetical protein